MFKYIKGMSLDKKQVESKILSITDQLTEHLIKLYLYPDSEYVTHWRQEVWSFLHRVYKLKSTNKYPNYKMIYDLLSGYSDMVGEIMWSIVEDYSSLIYTRSDETELASILDQYFKWISNELSTNGTVSSNCVHTKLAELGL